MTHMTHTHCVSFLSVSSSLQKDELYLNLVLDFVPETVYRVIRHHSKAKQVMPQLYVKVRREEEEGERERMLGLKHTHTHTALHVPAVPGPGLHPC